MPYKIPPAARPRKYDAPAIGTLFGLYEVISDPVRRVTGVGVWCRCQCGKERWVSIVTLIERRRGCWDCVRLKYGRPEIGKRYGRLVVLDVFQKRGQFTYALCQCDCGNTREVYGSLLGNGDVTQCHACTRPRPNWTQMGVRRVGRRHIATCPRCQGERIVNIMTFKGLVAPPLCGKCKRKPRKKVQHRAMCPGCGWKRKIRKWEGDPDPLCRSCQNKENTNG